MKGKFTNAITYFSYYNYYDYYQFNFLLIYDAQANPGLFNTLISILEQRIPRIVCFWSNKHCQMLLILFKHYLNDLKINKFFNKNQICKLILINILFGSFFLHHDFMRINVLFFNIWYCKNYIIQPSIFPPIIY